MKYVITWFCYKFVPFGANGILTLQIIPEASIEIVKCHFNMEQTFGYKKRPIKDEMRSIR